MTETEAVTKTPEQLKTEYINACVQLGEYFYQVQVVQSGLVQRQKAIEDLVVKIDAIQKEHKTVSQTPAMEVVQ